MNTQFPVERILLGPGPSPVSSRVLRALAAPTLGHLDPQYLAILDETCEMLRQIFQTKNALTFPVSGTGMAGMECVAVNLIEPGDEVIVCVNGVFGGRMKDVMERCGATVHGHELRVDDWEIDAIYSGTQKCLSCPPGLAPVSFGGRALAKMDARKTKPQSWYLDVSMLRKYYTGAGGGRVYHHTAPINMTYALREALAIVLEEGLDNRIARHAKMHQRLRAGLEAMGLSYIPKHSLHTLNCINIPAGADDAAVRKRLLDEYGIEIGAGLGVMAGKAWRIGLMGHGSTVRNVALVLAALREILG